VQKLLTAIVPIDLTAFAVYGVITFGYYLPVATGETVNEPY